MAGSTTTTIAPEMSGLRKRFSVLRPLDAGHDALPLSEIRILHEDQDKGEGQDEINEEDEDEASLESSFTSVTSSLSNESGGTCAEETLIDDRHGLHKPTVEESGKDEEVRPRVSLTSASHKKAPARFQHRQRRRTRGGSDANRTADSETSSGSWFGYDLSIIVALVSPIGNLLTGSDHIKNILLLLLLIYYLHQLVEVPWTLYRMSVPVPSRSTTSSEDEEPYKQSAHDELQALELSYLVLTVLSPFLGATLLRYVATAITGKPETLSWFSTALFVLATGVRPWSHLVERLKDRSRALNELLADESGAHGRDGATSGEETQLDEEMKDLNVKFASLDTRLSHLATKNTQEWDELADHIADVVDSVEQTLRRHDAERVRTTQVYDARFAALEAHIRGIDAQLLLDGRQTDGYLRGKHLRSLLWELLALPWSMAAVVWVYISSVAPQLGAGKGSIRAERRKIGSPLQRLSSLPSIPEEDIPLNRLAGLRANESDHTLVANAPERRGIPQDLALWIRSAFLSIAAFLLSPMTFALRVTYLLISLPQTLLRSVFA